MRQVYLHYQTSTALRQKSAPAALAEAAVVLPSVAFFETTRPVFTVANSISRRCSSDGNWGFHVRVNLSGHRPTQPGTPIFEPPTPLPPPIDSAVSAPASALLFLFALPLFICTRQNKEQGKKKLKKAYGSVVRALFIGGAPVRLKRVFYLKVHWFLLAVSGVRRPKLKAG